MRICLHGPESTGKTTLCRQLAERYAAPWIPEFARDYYATHLQLRRLDDPRNAVSVYADITQVAIGQFYAIRHFAGQGRMVFLDTDPLATLAYSRHYFGKTPDWLEDACRTPPSDFYLLTDVDLDWQPDPLRDRPDDKAQMLALFEEELRKRNAPYARVHGVGEERLASAAKAVDGFLSVQE